MRNNAFKKIGLIYEAMEGNQNEPKGMNISGLTDEEMAEVRNAWEADEDEYHQLTHTREDGMDAFDVSRAHPEWCFANDPEKMLNTYPHWVAINQPEYAFDHDPLNTTKANNRWVKENRPEYWAEYRKKMRSAGYGPSNGMGIEEL